MPFASPRLAAPRPAAADRGAFEPESTEPLTLPPAWTPPARPPLPVVAAIVPIVGAIGLWLVTGSILSLWLAALGPLIAVATLADAARSTRRDRRRHLVDADRAHTEVAQTVARRHDHERRLAWARHPDVTSLLDRDEEIWRRSPGRGGWEDNFTGSIGGRQITSAARSQSESTLSGLACERKPLGKTTSTTPLESRTTCQFVTTSARSSRTPTSVPVPYAVASPSGTMMRATAGCGVTGPPSES